MPIKLKLTLAFAGVMSLVLIAVGLFVYFRFRAELNHSLDQTLRSRSTEVAATYDPHDGTIDIEQLRIGSPEETFDQLVGPHGAVVGPAGARTGRYLRAPIPVSQARLTRNRVELFASDPKR